MSLRLDWCTHAAATYAVEHWHYSRSLPPPPHNSVGVWEDDAFIGCVLFARGASSKLLQPYGLRMTEGCELVRVALRAHRAPVSRIVAIAIRLLVQRSPGLRLIVSFADPAEGHHGGIYQALGWLYTGTTHDSTLYVGPDGKRWHSRMISATGVRRVYGLPRAVLRPEQCTPVDCPGKHRYLWPLDASLRARLQPLVQPYPKRVRGAEIGTLTTSQRGRCDSDPDAPERSEAHVAARASV
jgi:hypothetical protein